MFVKMKDSTLNPRIFPCDITFHCLGYGLSCPLEVNSLLVQIS